MKKHTEEIVVDPAQAADETREVVLGPLRQAFESVKTEVEAFNQATEKHTTRIDALKSKKATLDQKYAEMRSYQSNEDIDVEELTISLRASKEGAELIGGQLEKAETQAPSDNVLKAAWRNCKANFDELRLRIIHYYERQEQAKLDEIAWIHAEPTSVRNFCNRCGSDNGSQSAPGRLTIHFRREALSRAYDLNLNPGDIENAARSIESIAAELANVDIAELGPYEKPIVEAPVVEADKPGRPKEKYSVARVPPQPTALHPMSTSAFGGMADALAEAEARNEAQRQEWRKAGTLPHGNPLQVNQSLT